MKTHVSSLLLAGLLLTLALPAQAQLVAEPSSVSVAVGQGDESERTVTLTNTGSKEVSFCLNFERPLQRQPGLRLSKEAAGAACGEIGEILFELDEEDAGFFWDPYGLAMTPDGRLFTSDSSELELTVELTTELEVVRSFEQPVVDQVGIVALTRGVTYNADTGTLWWLNIEQDVVGQELVVVRALLLEGDLDGVATGRRIELPITESPPPGEDTIDPYGVAYDPATARFYYSDAASGAPSRLWAIDTLGNVVTGYPVGQNAYPEAFSIGFGPDVYGGAHGDAEAVRVELTMALEDGFDRLVVVDPLGHALGVETLLPDVSGGTGFGSIEGEPLRSRIDPNGVLYFPFVNFDTEGVVGIRPHPLPPSWLSLDRWDGELEPGESAEITLTFATGTRDVGNTYEAALQIFDGATGEALEIPLTLEVAEGTDAEPGETAGADEVVRLGTPYPNPAVDGVTVPLTVERAAVVRVAIYDVLGREVTVLHDGPLTSGTHRFSLSGRRLPAGFYVVRATGEGLNAARGLTLVR